MPLIPDPNNPGKLIWVPDSGPEKGPIIEKFPDGSLRQWDGKAWVTIGEAQPATGSAGRTFEQDMQLAMAPRSSFSSSSSVSQSFQDPAALQIQRDSLAEQIRQADIQAARDAQLLEFNRDKFRVETEQGNKQLALQTQTLAESIASRMEQSALARQRMTQDLAMFDKQIAATAQQAAANRAFEGGENAADRMMREREGISSRNLTREQMALQAQQADRADKLQRDEAIARFAANPGDVGMVSALLQRGGFSNLSTAVGNGESAITDRSLGPLSQLMAQGQTPSYTPQYEKQGSGIVPSPTGGAGFVTDGSVASTTPEQSAAFLAAQAANGFTGPAQQTAKTAEDVVREAWEPGGAYGTPKLEEGGAVVEPGVLNSLMALVQALGLEPKAIAGERGAASGETVYGDPGANIVVMPDKGKGAAGKPAMAEGGGLLNPLLERARAFMDATGKTALDRSGFASSPTPIQLADPGTDPFVRRLGAATTATTRGIPQESFLNELLRLIPQGQQYGMGGRTR